MANATPAIPIPANERFVLHGVSWQTYDDLCGNVGDHPIRLTFDGSNLEIMSPSRWHEVCGRFFGLMIVTLAAELDIPIGIGGSTTFRRADLQRGLEADECYWISNERAVREKREIDLTIDPPPDLAIEIDVSPSRLNRPAIYAALRVPEIWRFDGENLHVELLQADGSYHPSETSLTFAFLPVHELARFLALAEQQGVAAGLRAFTEWVREQHFEA
ncbi:MAG TPA: Uma2 family endonuclease [Planctomycetaceae bacterium]